MLTSGQRSMKLYIGDFKNLEKSFLKEIYNPDSKENSATSKYVERGYWREGKVQF